MYLANPQRYQQMSYARCGRSGLQLPKITLRDLVEFEKEYMAEKPYRYIILGDEKELDMDLLQKIGPIKRLSTEEIFGY